MTGRKVLHTLREPRSEPRTSPKLSPKVLPCQPASDSRRMSAGRASDL